MPPRKLHKRQDKKPCELCGSKKHTKEYHKCPTCNGFGHCSADHKPSSKTFVGYFCLHCYRNGDCAFPSNHNTNRHKCDQCGIKGHGESRHECGHCSNYHLTEDHTCELCGGLHASQFGDLNFVKDWNEKVAKILINDPKLKIPRVLANIIIEYTSLLAHYQCETCSKWYDSLTPHDEIACENN